MIELGRLTGCPAGRLLKRLKCSQLPIDWPDESLVRAWWKGIGLGEDDADMRRKPKPNPKPERSDDDADTRSKPEASIIRVHIAGLVMPSRTGRELRKEVAMLYEPIYGTLYFNVAASFDPELDLDHEDHGIGKPLKSFIGKSLSKFPASLSARIGIVAFTRPHVPVDIDEVPDWYMEWTRPKTFNIHGKRFTVTSLPKTPGYARVRLDLCNLPAESLRQALRAAEVRYNTYQFKILGPGPRSPKERMWENGER